MKGALSAIGIFVTNAKAWKPLSRPQVIVVSARDSVTVFAAKIWTYSPK